MKTASRFTEFFNRFVNYLKGPNPKASAALFANRGAEGAARAAINRGVRHQQIVSVRRNTRGLPVGVSAHQVKAAMALSRRLASKSEDLVVGDTRLQSAETTLDTLKQNTRLRKQNPRPSKLARRIASLH